MNRRIVLKLVVLFLSISMSGICEKHNFPDLDVNKLKYFNVTQISTKDFEYKLRIKGNFTKKSYVFSLINVYTSSMVDTVDIKTEVIVKPKNGVVEYTIPKYVVKADYFIIDEKSKEVIYYNSFFKLYIPLIQEVNLMNIKSNYQGNSIYHFDLNKDIEALRDLSVEDKCDYEIYYYDIFRDCIIELTPRYINRFCIELNFDDYLDKFLVLNRNLNKDLNNIHPLLGEIRLFYKGDLVFKRNIDVLFAN